MLRLPHFHYFGPSSLDEALSLLKENDGNIKILAGGTDILPSMKQKLFTPRHILDLKKVGGLNEVKDGSHGGIKIGTLSTLTAIEESSVVREKFPALAEAASLVAATQLKNMGTLGGNIALDTRCWYFNQPHFWRKSIELCLKRGGKVCHAVKSGKKCYAFFAADTVPALVALNAWIIIKNAEGERRCLLKEIYTQDGKNPHRLKGSEVMTEVVLPLPQEGSGSCYQKLRLRGTIDFPLVGAAAQVELEGNTCREAKIVLGAVGSGPIEVSKAEELLKGKPITEEVIEEVGNIAQKAAQPAANTKMTPGYRRKMAGVLIKKALREAISRVKFR